MIPGRQAISGFDPRMIPGLGLWLDAADSNTITVTSGNVSTWMDKSSNGYTFSNGALTGRRGPTRVSTLNGLDVLTFTATSATDTAGQYLSNTVVATGYPLYTQTVFTVHNPAFFATNYGDASVYTATYLTAADLRVPQCISAVAGSRILATGLPTTDASTTDVSTNYNLLVLNLDANRGLVCRNGLQQNRAVRPAGTEQVLPRRDVSLTVGAQIDTGIRNFFVGTVAEILQYNRSLAPEDQRRVEGYLAWKWGLQNNLPTTRTFSSNAPLSRPFRPIDIPDCIVWFDAADTRTLTLSGTQVTSWQNKGLLSTVTATNTTASPLVNAPGTVSSGYTFNTSSLNTVQFPATTYLAVSNIVTTTPARTLFFVFTVTSYGDGYSSLFKSSTFSGNRQITFNAWNRDGDTINMYPSAYSATEYLGGGAMGAFSGTLPYTGVPFVVGLRHTANSVSNGYVLTNAISINGQSIAPPVNQKLSFGYYVGSDTFLLGTGPGYNNTQRIGEVVQYDRALSDSEMRNVEGYLCQKWSVSFADVSHAFVKVPPTVPASFLPSLIPGCIGWFDAADLSTITATGSSVTSWRDKSGLGNTMTFTSSPTTGVSVQNGNNIVTFAGGYGTAATCVVNAENHTLFAVHKPSAAASNTSLFRFQTGTASPYVVFPYYSAATARGWVTSVDGATLSNTGAGLPESSSTTSFTLISACIASASQEVFSNGVLVASNTQILTTTTTPALTVGATTTGTEPYGGGVGELLVYNSKLSTAQRQLVEGYLAKKWAV